MMRESPQKTSYEKVMAFQSFDEIRKNDDMEVHTNGINILTWQYGIFPCGIYTNELEKS